MTYPPEWPAPGKMHFRLLHDRLGALDLHCDRGYVVNAYDLGFPEIREVKLNNSLDDGTFDVTRFFGARVVSLDVTLKSHVGLTPASPFISPEPVLRDKLTGYLYPGIRSRLLFSENGDPRVRQMMIRGTSASLAVDRANYNKLNVSWVAPRGVLYSYDERCYHFVFSVTSDDVMTLNIVNEGTVPVDWRAAISGYLVHPVFTLNGTETLQLIYDADPGDVIALDSFTRSITVNGKPSSFTYGNNAPEWFQIPPGISTLTIEHEHFDKQPGYPYAYWQQPAVPPIVDEFARADGPLGASWTTPTVIPDDTVSVPLAINSGAVVVTVPDGGVIPHEWGFARNVTAISGGIGQYIEVAVSNLAQSVLQGASARSKVELYTNMNAADAACQALSVDFDYGLPADPVAPVIFEEPFETTSAWTVIGSGTSIIPVGVTGKALQITGTVSSLTYDIDVADRDGILIVGAAVRVVQTTGATISSTRDLFEFRAASTLLGKVSIDNGGSLYATDATGTNRGGSPAGSILPNVWYYIEARYVLSDTAGEFDLRIDGVDVAGAFSLDTNPGFTTVYDQVRIPTPNPTSGGTHQFDDLYVAAGPDATFNGPVNVANGSLVWSLHQYDTGGAPVNTVASGILPFDYTATAVRLRLESGTDGTQRFLLNDGPVAEATEDTPIVGTLVGFGANYETFTYDPDPGGFTDDFERAALGADWVLPVARSSGKTVVLPTIATGAAVSAGHTTNAPQQVYSATTTGTTLVGGAAQNLPGGTSFTAGYLGIARVAQTNGNGTAITASTGWTELGTQIVLGNAAGTFKEPFDHLGAWTPTGTTAIVTGRTGNAVRITGANGSNYIAYRLPTGDATVIVGFAHQVNSLAGIAEVAQFYGDTNATQHNRVFINTNGSIAVTRGATTLGTSAAGVIAINTWNYIEIRLTLSDTVGTVDVRVNGTSVLALTAQDTKNAGTATVYDTVRLTGPIASFYNQFDDLYILTGGAAAFTGSQTITTPAGVEYLRHATFVRIADGTSQDALTVTGGPGDFVTTMESYWQQSAGYAGTDILTRLLYASTTGVSGFADPAALTLGTTNDWLFLESVAVDVINTFPSMSQSSSYSSIGGTTTSPGGLVAIRPGYRTATTSGSEDPGAYSGSVFGTRPWIAVTIGLPNAGGIKWGGAEQIVNEFDATATIGVEAVVNSTATGGPPMVELYSHMVHGSPACRVLQVDLLARTWRMGHYAATGNDMVAAASGSLPAGAYPVTLRLESDPDRTERFLFNGALVQTIVDATAPTPTGATRVGFGEFSTTSYTPPPQIPSFTATGVRYASGPPPATPTSPRVERFVGGPVSGTNWAIPPGVLPANNPAPGGKPPWAWTPPVDPITGEPSILSVHFCFFDQWI